MRIIDRYVVKEFLRNVVITLFAFVAIYFIIDLFERVDDIIEHSVPLSTAVKYYFFKLPFICFNVFPFTLLFASLLTVRQFVANNEIVAITSSAVSPYRFLFPIVILGVIFTVFVFAVNEMVLPYTNEKFEEYGFSIRGKIDPAYRPSNDKVQERWYKGENNTFYNMDILIKSSQEIRELTIYKVDDDFNLKERIDAEKARYRNDQWIFKNGILRKFKKDSWTVKDQFEKEPTVIPEKFDDFLKTEKEPGSMSYFELRKYLERIKKSGIAPEQAVSYLVDLYSKFSIPASAAVMTILGIPFAIRSRRFKGAMSGIALSVGIGFSYWILFYMFVSLGHGGKLPAIIAAFAPVAIFAIVGFYLFLDLNRRII